MTGEKRNQETIKVTMKMGSGGGGIGAVVLLGGALATAALASAFVVGRNGRSSGHKSPPVSDESDKEQECNVVEQPLIENKSPSSEEIKEIESDSDKAFMVSNQETKLDVNLIVEKMNSGKPDNLCDNKLETDSISDGHVVIEEKIPLFDEELQFEPQNDDGVTIELSNEDAADKGISKGNQNLDERVLSEEERAESEPIDEFDGEIEETSHHKAVEITEKQPKLEGNRNEAVCYDEEEIKVVLVDNNEVEEKSEPEERHVIDNGEMIFSESDSEDGQKTIQPVLEGRVIEDENVNGDEKKVIVEIGKENEFVEESEGEEEEEDHIEEQFVKEQEECDHPDELLVVEKHEDPACLVNYPTLKEELISPENVEVTTKDRENYLEGEIENEVEGEVVIISPENIESTEANKNETSLQFAVVGQEKQDEDEDVERNIVIEEIEGLSETIYIETNDSVTKKNGNDQTVLSDEVRLVDREVGGKIQEDKVVKNGEHDSNDGRIIGEDSSFEHHQEKSEKRTLNSGKAFTVKNYMIMNDRLTNSTNRRLIIAILSVMSSFSCSWFFGLSSVQLCLIVLLTMMISSMATE